MSTADTVWLALGLLALSILPLVGIFAADKRHPVVSWVLQGVFVIMAGTAITWLLLVLLVKWWL